MWEMPILVILLWPEYFIVFVLGQDKGCTIKYSLLPKGTFKGKMLYLTIYNFLAKCSYYIFRSLYGNM